MSGAGDLNDLQQMALMALMADEADADFAREGDRFRSMIVAMHPGEAKQILEALDSAPKLVDGEIPEFAPEMTEEEMDEYQPFSAEEVGQTIDLLRRFGVAVS